MSTREFVVRVPESWGAQLESERTYFENVARQALATRLESGESAEARLELVRVICRAKASVCNWRDLEREILESSI